ncbi:MAG: hypothetical protein NTZ17_16230 [Phycisphaerae bacterium]|nr:hypothetical protein [Phycisphaerae bacterium]
MVQRDKLKTIEALAGDKEAVIDLGTRLAPLHDDGLKLVAPQESPDRIRGPFAVHGSTLGPSGRQREWVARLVRTWHFAGQQIVQAFRQVRACRHTVRRRDNVRQGREGRAPRRDVWRWGTRISRGRLGAALRTQDRPVRHEAGDAKKKDSR